jgi:hypothetical protein
MTLIKDIKRLYAECCYAVYHIFNCYADSHGTSIPLFIHCISSCFSENWLIGFFLKARFSNFFVISL